MRASMPDTQNGFAEEFPELFDWPEDEHKEYREYRKQCIELIFSKPVKSDLITVSNPPLNTKRLRCDRKGIGLRIRRDN